MPKVYAIDGLTPVVDPSAFVHPSLAARRVRPHRHRSRSERPGQLRAAHVFPGRTRSSVRTGVRQGAARIPARSLAAGIPARILRALSEDEVRWKDDNTRLYQQLAARSRESLREVEALTEVEPQRRRIDIPGSFPLSELKKRHG
jgi:hypothetical protein